MTVTTSNKPYARGDREQLAIKCLAGKTLNESILDTSITVWEFVKGMEGTDAYLKLIFTHKDGTEHESDEIPTHVIGESINNQLCLKTTVESATDKPHEMVSFRALARFDIDGVESKKESAEVRIAPPIKKAYFATKKEEYVKTDKTCDYLMKNLHTTPTGSKERTKVIDYIHKNSKVEQGYYVTKEGIDSVLPIICMAGSKIEKIPLYTKSVIYEPLSNTVLGNEVYIVAETKLEPNSEVTLEVFEKRNKFVAKDTPLTLLELKGDKKEELSSFKASVDQDKKAIIKVALRPESDDTFKKWKDHYKVTPFEQELKENFFIKASYGESSTNSPSLKVEYRIAPWMEVVLDEYKNYGDKEESAISARIETYLKTTSTRVQLGVEKNAKGEIKEAHEFSWCAAFVNWCFQQTDNYEKTNKGNTATAFDWGPTLDQKSHAQGSKLPTPEEIETAQWKAQTDGWKKNGEEITKAEDVFYGALYIWNKSHIGFVVGIDKLKKEFLILGGNQGDGIRYAPFSIDQAYAIMKPKKYTPRDFEKKLPLFNPSDYKKVSTI